MAKAHFQVQRHPGELRVPCTKDDVRCQLLEHRAAINSVLLDAGLEIRGDHRHAGGIRLAVSRSAACQDFSTKENPWQKNSGLKLAYDLLTHHKCFTALEMYSDAPCPYAVREALRRSRTVKILIVHIVMATYEGRGSHRGTFQFLNSLPSLEEIVFEKVRPPYMNGTMPANGQPLITALRHLTKIDAECLHFSAERAHAFILALTHNVSVTDLALNGSVLYTGRFKPGKMLCWCLLRKRSTLKKLKLKGGGLFTNRALWTRVTDALHKLISLEELCLDVIVEYDIFGALTASFAQLPFHCKTLRHLQLPAPCYRPRTPESDDKHWTKPWVGTLRATCQLRELRISLQGTSDAQCRSLFRSIAGNVTLKRVIIQDYTDNLDLEMLVKIIQELDLGDRVHFRYFYVSDSTWHTRPWQEIFSVNFNTVFFEMCSWFGGDVHVDCCRMASRRGTTTKFKVWCSWVFKPDVDEWFTWLAESPTLTYVQILNVNHPGKGSCDLCAELCDKVVSALAKNSSITTLALTFFTFRSVHIDMLCQYAREHRSLTEITLTPYCPPSQACPFAKCSELSEEFRAAALKLQDVVRENASRILAAAKFVLGEETRHGACAVEELSDHPRLVEQVRDDGELSDADAQAMVKRTVLTLRNCDVHKYMRLAGVVKGQQVTPLDRDVQQHILTLTFDCWLHIRRYLKIADVSV